MTDRATLRVVDEEDASVATLTGEVDSSNAQELCSAILDQVANDTPGLVLDLAGVSYFDSSGISIVFRIARALAARRQRVAVALPAESPLRRLFEVTSVESVAPLAKTAAEARTLLSAPLGDL